LEADEMKSKLGAILLGILIFLLGGITGAVSHYLYREHLKAAFFKAAQRPPDIVGGLARELKLDARQTELLRTIFDDSRKRYMDLSQQFWPQYDTIRKETDQQIKDILNEDQKARYEAFLKKIQPPPPMPPDGGKKPNPPQDFNPVK
jgi:hypothetical protein